MIASEMRSIEFRLLVSYVRRRWRMYTVVWGVSAVGVVIQTTLPFLIRALLDDALPAHEIGLAVGLVVAIGGAHLLHRLTVIGNRIGRERGQVRMTQDLRTDLFAQLIRRDAHFFDQQTSGDLTDRLMWDTNQASLWSQHLVMKGLLGVLELAGPLVAAFLLNWRMALAMVALAPVLWLIRRFITPREQAALQTERRLAAAARSFAQEAIEGRRFIGASQTQAHAQARLQELNQQMLTEGSYRLTTLTSYQHNMWMTARGLGLLLVFAIGVNETLAGRTTPGTLAAFVFTTMLFFFRARVPSGLLQQLASAVGAVATNCTVAQRAYEAAANRRGSTSKPRCTAYNVQRCLFRVHRRPRGAAADCELSRRTPRVPGHRRSHRLGQDHRGRPADALL